MQVLKDIHQEKELRGVNLQWVGIRDLHWPFIIKNGNKKTQLVNARVSLYLDLNAKERAVHMSRLVRNLHFFSKKILRKDSIKNFLQLILRQSGSKNALFKIDFIYLKLKNSPVTKNKGYMSYKCGLEAKIISNQYKLKINVKVPILTLCPCSLAISKTGAHNQRSQVKIEALVLEKEWFGDLISIVEDCASSELYSVLRRPDEKAVIDKAMKRPRFVEDIVREVALALKNYKYKYTKINCKSFESIHNHNAYAEISLEK